MAVHEEVLAAAQRICRERGTTTFAADDIVRLLPHLNPATIRTHVTSRCCVNAPRNHPHKWDYFKRCGRGSYELTAGYRTRGKKGASMVRETAVAYGATAGDLRHTLHGVIGRSGKWYSAECLELPVVTQGRTLDETVTNLQEAIALHLQGEDLPALGLAPALALQVTFDTPITRVASA